MKKLQLILRIIVSPIIFMISLGMMILFPGFLLFGMGIGQIIFKSLGGDVDDSYKDLLFVTFIGIIFPFINTYSWIMEAKMLD